MARPVKEDTGSGEGAKGPAGGTAGAPAGLALDRTPPRPHFRFRGGNRRCRPAPTPSLASLRRADKGTRDSPNQVSRTRLAGGGYSHAGPRLPRTCRSPGSGSGPGPRPPAPGGGGDPASPRGRPATSGRRALVRGRPIGNQCQASPAAAAGPRSGCGVGCVAWPGFPGWGWCPALREVALRWFR
ncbi:hypothetical protein VULLAG_LOCUS4622 [Vulpes lagopus]